jgi:hypothetical protein
MKSYGLMYGRKICIFGVSRPMAIFREIYVEKIWKVVVEMLVYGAFLDDYLAN